MIVVVVGCCCLIVVVICYCVLLVDCCSNLVLFVDCFLLIVVCFPLFSICTDKSKFGYACLARANQQYELRNTASSTVNCCDVVKRIAPCLLLLLIL